MPVFSHVEAFLKLFCSTSAPLLLALSGGPDSLCLFYCLLTYRDRYALPFHVAHVDHGWRQESVEEAQILKQLALDHQIPFYLKCLNPHSLEGNLEAACREERYSFLAKLCQEINFQGVITGHHQDDQAETICKRILEGSHWSRWLGLKSESVRQGMRLLRPLLGVTKKDILHFLSRQSMQAFQDPTNRQVNFLRARLRQTIFPWLNQEFGKQVQKSFIEIGNEAQELVDYFDNLLAPLIQHLILGPWGTFLDLQSHLPHSLLEIKYLLRILCKNQQFFLSREILEESARALQAGQASRVFIMGSKHLWIDRRRLFILNVPVVNHEYECGEITQGNYCLGPWKLDVREGVYFSNEERSSWKEGWQGFLRVYLPLGKYLLGSKRQMSERVTNLVKVKKLWSQTKVPNFLFDYFPLICQESRICHEFLTGRPLMVLREGALCWKIELSYCLNPKN